jgi:formylmethanofuran dehydrogenase subunit E
MMSPQDWLELERRRALRADSTKTTCEQCGEQVKRRTRCSLCGKLLCRFCFHHGFHEAIS